MSEYLLIGGTNDGRRIQMEVAAPNQLVRTVVLNEVSEGGGPAFNKRPAQEVYELTHIQVLGVSRGVYVLQGMLSKEVLPRLLKNYWRGA